MFAVIDLDVTLDATGSLDFGAYLQMQSFFAQIIGRFRVTFTAKGKSFPLSCALLFFTSTPKLVALR